ncbi:MAG TPA: O-methyltransferase [Acidimicrobiales bacterium]|nr:O-methyltransferase [Acidimicrobiales bacterium]
MPDIVAAEIERYAENHTTPPPPYLEALAEETRSKLSAPGMMVGPVEGRVLEMLVFISAARRVLEIGTFTGYSALSMAAGLPDDGHIVTCEVDPRHAEMARLHISASPFADRIEVRLGRALETIRGLDGPFDLVFIDADKPGYVDYYEAVLPKLAPRGVIVADNTLWSGAVADPSEQDDLTKEVRAFNDHVASDPRVVCVQMTVRDGMTLIRRAD